VERSCFEYYVVTLWFIIAYIIQSIIKYNVLVRCLKDYYFTTDDVDNDGLWDMSSRWKNRAFWMLSHRGGFIIHHP